MKNRSVLVVVLVILGLGGQGAALGFDLAGFLGGGGQPCIDSPFAQCGPGSTSCNAVSAEAKVWFANLRAGRVDTPWFFGLFVSELDFSELGLDGNTNCYELEFKYRSPVNLGISYSYLPVDLQGERINPRAFFFQNFFFPLGILLNNSWRKTMNKLDVTYTVNPCGWITIEPAVGYRAYSENLTVSAPGINASRELSVTDQMMSVGALVTIATDRFTSANSGSLCLHYAYQFGGQCWGWEASAFVRSTVPISCRSSIFLEAGWKGVFVQRTRSVEVNPLLGFGQGVSERLELGGLFGSVGMAF